MNKRIIGGILCVFLALGCFSVFVITKDENVENVQNMIDELPAPDEIKDLTMEEQGYIYNNLHIPAGAAYEELTEEQKRKIDTDRMDVLNAYFNTLIEPIDTHELETDLNN